jgi:hypothetical protein
MKAVRQAVRAAVVHAVTVVCVVLGLVSAPAVQTAAAAAPTLTWHAPDNPDPFRGSVSSVDCVTANWCMVVDQSGQAVRYHDGRWDRPVRVETTPGVGGLQTVSCGSRNHCIALDFEGRVTRFSGSFWTKPAYVASGVTLEAVSCPTAKSCLAIGNRVARWNGSAWRVSSSALPSKRDLTHLSCSSPGFCMATFRRRLHGDTYAWKYRGGTWSSSARFAKTQDDDFFLSCTSRRFCMASGDPFEYERWDGSHWHRGSLGQPLNGSPGGVSCTSRSQCVLAGSYFHPASAEWNGHVWVSRQDFDTASAQDFAAVSCVGAKLTCLALDVMGGATWYTDHAWHRTVIRDAGWGEIDSVSCGSTQCVAADVTGGYVRTTGNGWTRPARSFAKGNFGVRSQDALSCTDDTFCLAAAITGAARRFDGQSWHRISPVPFGNAALSCLSAHWCAAMDSHTGQMSVYNGSTWHKLVAAFATMDSAWSLSCGSRTLCVASSGLGTVRVFNGTKWSAAKRIGPAGSSSSGVSCASATFCMALAGYDATWSYDGSAWHKVAFADNAYAISCVSSTFCAEVDWDGVQVFDGHTWTRSVTLSQPAGAPYQEIGCASRSLCVVSSPEDPVVVGTAA